jgi:Xaa-Pro aminopeptidase
MPTSSAGERAATSDETGMTTDYLSELRRHPDLLEPSFQRSEYAARVASAGKAMAARGIDIVLLNHLPSICYLTGYQTPATSDHNCLFLAQDGRTVLQVIEHEIPNAVLTSFIEDVRGFSWYRPETIPSQAADIVAELVRGRRAPTIGVEKDRPALTIALFETLKQSMPEARFVDASDLLNAQRAIKSAAEIAFLRESGRISVLGAEKALDAVRPGCTDNDIAAVAYETMMRAGSEYASTQPFIATGPRSGMVHTTFKRRPILPGQAVFVETASSIQRYTAPVMRSGFVGTPPPVVQRLRAGVASTLALLLETIAPRRSAHDVACAASAGFKAIRDEIYFQGAYGYHVGLSLPPAWWEGLTPYIAEGVEAQLQPGMVFHLPIAARIPGVCGVALSETVVVTETGCEPLTAPQRAFRDFPA